MYYAFDESFRRSLKRLDPVQRLAIKQRIDLFIRAISVRQLPVGFGLKKITSKLWEIRSGLFQRILYWRSKEEITFTFVGNHDEVRRFLKHLHN